MEDSASNPFSPGSPGELEEMMAIEIHFGKGRQDMILVRFGDEPSLLAKVIKSKCNCLSQINRIKIILYSFRNSSKSTI